MNPTSEISALQQMGTIVGSGGTVVATGIDFTPTYEPAGKAILTVGAGAAGAVVATVEQGTALAAGYASIGTIAAGTVAGLYSLDLPLIDRRFVRMSVTATGGTANVAAAVLAKLRTLP
jgi:hypothetical protein